MQRVVHHLSSPFSPHDIPPCPPFSHVFLCAHGCLAPTRPPAPFALRRRDAQQALFSLLPPCSSSPRLSPLRVGTLTMPTFAPALRCRLVAAPARASRSFPPKHHPLPARGALSLEMCAFHSTAFRVPSPSSFILSPGPSLISFWLLRGGPPPHKSKTAEHLPPHPSPLPHLH